MAPDQTAYAKKLELLRAALKARKLDGFIVPRTDHFQGENIAEPDERLRWLSGFTGSAGVAVVLQGKAVVLTDGRYTIQLKRQVDGKLFETGDSTKVKTGEWIAQHVRKGAVGYDPWLHTPAQLAALQKELGGTEIALVPVSSDPFDEIWKDRPPEPVSTAEIFPLDFAGIAAAEKLKTVAGTIAEQGADAAIIARPDSICWLLNVRGNDVDYSPLVLSHAIVHAEGSLEWFVAPEKIDAALRAHLGEAVTPRDFADIENGLRSLAGKKVLLDKKRSAAAFEQILKDAGAQIIDAKDPCVDPKAIKNKTEQNAIRKAHEIDGAAMVKFLFWLKQEAPKGKLDELKVEEKLEGFRKQSEEYRGPSFSTIAGYNENGAVVHYRATESTNKKIMPPGLLLIDSGGQYKGGTTDITRTVAVDEPAEEMKKNFTLVLKGHIAVAAAQVKPGTTGKEIDALARAPLKAEGLDYAHGTGHGVGCYLQVHEEAANFSPKGEEAVKPGMLISNEPGFYKENAYGIRIENLVLAQEEEDKVAFETVTLAPIDLNLIVPDMLDEKEKAWLNTYHARVAKTLAPLLDNKSLGWLKENTRAI